MSMKRNLCVALAGALTLAGCNRLPGYDGGGVMAATRSAFGINASEPAEPLVPDGPTLDPALQDGSQSRIIADLLERRSVLEPGPMREVADAVLAANARTGEAELRAAVLRSEAAQRNWLPRLGPSVSLTSLGDLASSMVLDAVLYDNGGKKAERAYAMADVEVAAAALAQDSNVRVLTALELYLEAEAATARADVASDALRRMERFDYMMTERVQAGISDRADQQFVAGKLAALEAGIAADRAAAETARSELQAMAARPLDGLRGISAIAEPSIAFSPIALVKSQAVATRSLAEAEVARAGQLPGLAASGQRVGGDSSAGVVAGGQGIGFGTGRTLQAIEASREASEMQVAEAREGAARRLNALRGQLASAERQVEESRALAAQARETFELADGRFQAGGRSILDLVSVLEARVDAERAAVSAPCKAALLRVRIAAEAGQLVDGDRI